MQPSRRKFMLGVSALAIGAAVPWPSAPTIGKTIDAFLGKTNVRADTWYHVFRLPGGDMGFDTDPHGKNLGLKSAIDLRDELNSSLEKAQSRIYDPYIRPPCVEVSEPVRIASIRTDENSDIIPFMQHGGTVYWE